MTEAFEPSAAAAVAVVTENTHVFRIPNTDTDMSLDFESVPAHVRLDMLKKAAQAYVTNSVNQANVRHNKAMAPWLSYAEAQAADPMQTAVAAPKGEAPTVDLIQYAKDARERLYKGEVRKQGTGKPRATKDPLVKLVTEAVVRELFDSRKAADSSYKWTDAVKAVGGEGIDFLNAMIAEKVAAGANEAELNKFRDERYIKPAEMMLGNRDNKATKDQSLFS